MPHSAYDFPYFVIEHNEADFSKDGWCYLEYANILRILTPFRVVITNMSPEQQKQLPDAFQSCKCITQHSIIDFLNPNVEASRFSAQETSLHSTLRAVETTQAVCFLDELGEQVLTPDDISNFTFIIVGGILGDHPPKDVGKYLRESPYTTVRNLGSHQMSTDTAVLACATVLRYQIPLHLLRTVDNYEAFALDVTSDDGTIPCLCDKRTKRIDSYSESTIIRMRYLTLHQPKLGKPITLRSGLSPGIAWWDPGQAARSSTQLCSVPRITPNLLPHIFESQNVSIDDLLLQNLSHGTPTFGAVDGDEDEDTNSLFAELFTFE